MTDWQTGRALLTDVTLVVVGYDCGSTDLDHINDLASHFGSAIFVDNGPQRHMLRSPVWEVILNKKNIGFGAAANRGARAARTPFVLFLNPDVRANIETIKDLVAALHSNPELTGVGPSLAPKNTIFETNAGGARKSVVNALVFALAPPRCLPHRQIWRSVFPVFGVMPVDWLSGACLLFRRDAFLNLGGFPIDYFLYDEDVALGHNAQRLGYRLGVLCSAKAHHPVGGTQRRSVHSRRWAASNQRHVLITSPSRLQALITLVLICIGLLRRSRWRSFIGQRRPDQYAAWSIYYLLRYSLWLPPSGPDPPP